MTKPEPDYQLAERMALKRLAIPLADPAGKSVLDIGCDFGYWSFLAAEEGAARVLGLDRNRNVKGAGYTDLIAMNRAEARARCWHQVGFEHLDIGRQWHEFGRFDIVYLFSLYHHIFENCGEHLSIWFWLWRHTAPGGELLWENPVDDTDSVVRRNVSDDKRHFYRRNLILAAAETYFDVQIIGPALHEPTREVWRCVPRQRPAWRCEAVVVSGAGGAAPAFRHAGGRRIDEIEQIIGARPVPGSLNLRLSENFDWSRNFYAAPVLDVVDRRAGLNSAWEARCARFYPLSLMGRDVWAFHYPGDAYPLDFVELVAPFRIRDLLETDEVTICSRP